MVKASLREMKKVVPQLLFAQIYRLCLPEKDQDYTNFPHHQKVQTIFW